MTFFDRLLGRCEHDYEFLDQKDLMLNIYCTEYRCKKCGDVYVFSPMDI